MLFACSYRMGLCILRVLADNRMLGEEKGNFNTLFAELLSGVEATLDVDSYDPFILFSSDRLKLRWTSLEEEELFEKQIPLTDELILRLDESEGYALATKAMHRHLQKEKYELASALADKVISDENPFMAGS